MTHQTEFDIIVIGGGLVGASAALALSQRWRVALLERQVPEAPSTAADEWDPRVYAISPGSRAFIESNGGWSLGADRAGPIRAMDVRGDAGGRIRFDAAEIGKDELAVLCENRSLQWSIWSAIQERVTCLTGTTVASYTVDQHGVDVALADGRTLRSKLLVGADGARSWVRETAGIGFKRWPYHQNGVVANFECAQPHQGIARQWFREDGILAWLPLPGNRISIVWSCGDALKDELLALSPEALADKVARAGGNSLGAFRTLTTAAAFPLALGRAEKVFDDRMVLIGDAAHTIHPLAGQGVNLGFGDARVLADVLGRLPGRDPGDRMALARFARERKEDVLLMQSVCDGLQKLFGHQHAFVGKLRNVGLSLTNRVAPVKRILMQQAFR
ncbi:UbiH/UbiF family hydroxylase [Burkholderiaceae bacterium DAT-1]|nr:UbiH/UbiF family hydroxylase [Burkholderiaceae bacterium DAT-1]